MSLDIFFMEDIRNALLALDQANDAALAVAARYGMNTEVAELCRKIYAGALADVGLSFGLSQTVLVIPERRKVITCETLKQ